MSNTTTTTTTTSSTTDAPADVDRSDLASLVTGLFTGGRAVPRDGISPGGAFQDALYGRSVLVDVRPLAQRLRTGHVDPQLFGEVVVTSDLPDPVTVAYEATLDRPGVPVHVLADDDATARRIVTRLAWFGVPAAHVEGGFPAWRAAGLPVLRAA